MTEKLDPVELLRELSDLRRRVDAMAPRMQVDLLRMEVVGLHDKLRHSLAAAREHAPAEIGRSTAGLDHLAGRPRDEPDRTLADHERRLTWMERHIRAILGAEGPSLNPTPELAALARCAERGRTLRAELLDEPAIRELTEVTETWQDWRRERRNQTDAAIEGSRWISSVLPGLNDRPHAERAYRCARAALARLDADREHIQRAAEAACERLAEDAARRDEYRPAIAEGQRAGTALTTRLRTMICATVDRAEVLPVWFDTALGTTPPPDTEPWLRTATELLAYRLSYAVEDPVAALGPEPPPDAPARRHEWYVTLGIQLKEHQP